MMVAVPTEIFGLNWTNTQWAILKLLSDGKAYNLKNIKAVYDLHAEDLAAQFHIHSIRKKISTSSYRIHSGVENGELVYRMVKLFAPQF